MNNSVDKLPKNSHAYRNTSANHKKGTDPFPAPMEQITERESENMTSARNRVYADDNNADNFSLSHTYQQWKRPEQTSASNTLLQSNFVLDPFKPKSSSNAYFNNFIGS